MIVSDRYENDDVTLAGEQHGVYWDASNIIVSECYAHCVTAWTILGSKDRWHRWPQVDHRTLQNAHDILAAAWRFRAHPQPSLFDDRGLAHPSMEEWIEWLRNEVRDWIKSPDLVLLVVTILFNQNTDKGYAAEEQLAGELHSRFEDVPWLRSLTSD